MPAVDLPALTRLLDQANAARRQGRIDAEAEARLEALHAAGTRLAVYGSLGPGRPNHHVVAPLGGTWTAGVVEGDLTTHGWGAALGFPALRLRPGGPEVAVQLLTSGALRAFWSVLDAFEGAEYRRILLPVWAPGAAGTALLGVANLFEAAGPGAP